MAAYVGSVSAMTSTVFVQEGEYQESFSSQIEPDWDVAIAVARHAIRTEGDEAEVCGYIVMDSMNGALMPRIIVVDNIAEKPGRFDMSAEDCFEVYEAMAEGCLVGVWHSHPNGSRQPSKRDWDNHPHGVDMYIVCIESPSSAMVLRYCDDDRP